MLRADWVRLRDSLPAIAQIVAASVAAFLLAQLLFQQSSPLIAAIIPISSLGFVGDARPIRVVETAIAMTLGISLAELLLLGFGQAAWTFAVALLVTLALARFVSAKAAFAIAAAVQCTLVMLGPLPEGGPFIRSADALVGGVVAILASGLLPRNPWGTAVRSGQRLLATHADVLGRLARSLRSGDVDRAAHALARARGTNDAVDTFREAVDSGHAIAEVSPWIRHRRAEFARLGTMVEPLDLATRGLRVVARRVDYLLSLGDIEPELADLLDEIAAAITLLESSIAQADETGRAQAALLAIARRLNPATIAGQDVRATEANVIHATRPYLTDLLVSTGLGLDAARAALAPID